MNGVTIGSRSHSVARHYAEASYGKLTFTAQVFGPYSLPDAYVDYSDDEDILHEHYYRTCVSVADDNIDYRGVDSVVLVSRDHDTVSPARRAAAYGSIPKWGPYTTAEGDLSLGMISLPSTFGTDGGTRPVSDVLSHELGHNLGLGDQYRPPVPQPPPSAGRPDRRTTGASRMASLHRSSSAAPERPGRRGWRGGLCPRGHRARL